MQAALAIKKGPARAFLGGLIWRELLAEAGRGNVTAVAADDSAGYGIIVTSSGSEAAKASGNESAGDLLHFLFIQSAGANPAEYAIVFHCNAPFLDFLRADYKSDEEG